MDKGNPIRGRLNAWFFRTFDDYINRLTSAPKKELFSTLPDEVLEIGAGTGANFRYFRKLSSVTAMEPNPHMLPALREQAAAHELSLHVLTCSAERIPLPDDSVDAVVSTLVLCTVADAAGVLAEIKRVLRPKGRLLFLEHVAATEGSWRRWLQDCLHGPWRYLFEGCHTNRETERLIKAAGFSAVQVDRYILRGPFVPVSTQIAGIATK